MEEKHSIVKKKEKQRGFAVSSAVAEDQFSFEESDTVPQSNRNSRRKPKEPIFHDDEPSISILQRDINAFNSLLKKGNPFQNTRTKRKPVIPLDEDESGEEGFKASEIKKIQEEILLHSPRRRNGKRARRNLNKENRTESWTRPNSDKSAPLKEAQSFHLSSKQSQSDESEEEVISRKPRRRTYQVADETQENSPIFDIVIGSQHEVEWFSKNRTPTNEDE